MGFDAVINSGDTSASVNVQSFYGVAIRALMKFWGAARPSRMVPRRGEHINQAGLVWHARENGQVKPLDELLHIYYSSVGGNATLLLNIPPDTHGLFHENDVARLREIGQHLHAAFAADIAQNAAVSASESLDGAHCPQNV